ncbi:MAG: hypothetical protein K6F04_01090 [bacterium]|nr:hypothetical protein [bacterium]
MKKFLKIILSLVLLFTITDSVFAKKIKKSKKRSASAASGLVSSKAKAIVSSKKTVKSSSKKKKSSSKKKSKDEKKESDSEESELSATEQCMVDNLETLLSGECKFLNEPEVLSELSNKFYCIYNYKDKSKAESVYNYYLYQNYATNEESIKEGDASVVIKNPQNGNLKGASKYYETLISGAEDGTLSDGKILDFLTEEVLDSDSSLTSNEISAIQKISIDSATITMDVVKENIETCKKATKKIVNSCGIASNEEMQDKIISSCDEYNTALVKRTANNKAKVMDLKAKLVEILRNRANTSLKKSDKSETSESKDTEGKSTETKDTSKTESK